MIRSFAKIILFLWICSGIPEIKAQLLKSVVYDFDGLGIGQTDLPEGDYQRNDLSAQVAANPLAPNDMIGDRVLRANLTWNTGVGVFGRGTSRFIEFDPNSDVFNFYFYNPVSNANSASIDVVITEDDDQNNSYSFNNDDAWIKSLTIPQGSNWQLISIPLNSFSDSNPGGNGIFDATFTGAKGMLLMVEFRFKQNMNVNATFYLDMICFSDGSLPVGSSITNLPSATLAGKCPLGAFSQKNRGQEYQIPTEIEGLFPAISGKKLKYVNYFMQWSYDGTTVPKELPGNEVTQLLNGGYRPIITWEPMFQGFDRLDSRQPRLNNIINGDYDAYIDAFADKIKSYNDTIIIRLMHEFEGNWYSWSMVYNGEDPSRYVTAYRKIVDRFRARGANKVKWMWCLNADYYPYRAFNFAVRAYPGDNYVDIVANDIYNSHYPENLPWWMSFKYKAAETYYYLTKYFSHKPLIMCELGCRERLSTESTSLQSKGDWLAKMDKELHSTFCRIKGLVFFNANHVGDWRLNSSQASLNSVTENIWKDDYYFENISSTPQSTCSGTGSILREFWANVSGTSLSSVPFNSTPTSTTQLNIFEGPSSVGDNYGSRISGYVCPPVSGDYIFWIASDNQSELWISTNEEAANKVKRAYVNDYTSSRQWTKYPSQQSVPIQMEAGQKYYIEAIHREGTQGDNLAVGWQLPGGVLERPIPGNRLIPVPSSATPQPTLCNATITPGGSTTFCSGGNVTLFTNKESGINYQWIKNGLNIGGATSYSYNASTSGDYQVKISFLGCTDWSSPTKVTVNTSLVAKITAGGPTSFCQGGALVLYANTCDGYIYQWKKNGIDILGAKAATYTVTSSGNYQVKIIQGSAVAFSSQVAVTVSACKQSDSASLALRVQSNESAGNPVLSENEDLKLIVYPNPGTGLFHIQLCIDEVKEEAVEIKLQNLKGEEIYSKSPGVISGCINETVEISDRYEEGIYALKIRIGEKIENIKVLLRRN